MGDKGYKKNGFEKCPHPYPLSQNSFLRLTRVGSPGEGNLK
jgi:hypothetical protein